MLRSVQEAVNKGKLNRREPAIAASKKEEEEEQQQQHKERSKRTTPRKSLGSRRISTLEKRSS
jgi:hypothetical protein